MIRVSESMQKAAQMGSQIRDDQKKNTHLAQFLTFLFGAVQNDEIWSAAVELFSSMDTKINAQVLAIYELVALFLPFYSYKAQELGLDLTFPSLHYAIQLSEADYIAYVRTLSSHYPLYATLDKDTLVSLISSLLLYHQLVVVPEGKTFDDIIAQVRSAL